MAAGSRADPSKKARVGSKAAGVTGGATGGTLFVLLADCLPEHSPWKRWILAAAPSVTVGLSAFSFWGMAEVTNYWNRRRDEKKLEWGEKTCQNLLKTAGMSEENKKLAAHALEEIRKTRINNITSAILGQNVEVLVQNVEVSAEKDVEQTSAAKRGRD